MLRYVKMESLEARVALRKSVETTRSSIGSWLKSLAKGLSLAGAPLKGPSSAGNIEETSKKNQKAKQL
jgi:hypothetical protein